MVIEYIYCYLFVDRVTLFSLSHVYSLLNRQGEEPFLDFIMLSHILEHCVSCYYYCVFFKWIFGDY